MTVKPPPTHVPQDLFPAEDIASISGRRIERAGESRVIYGEIVNQVVNALLGFENIPGSGSHDIVFDSFLRGRQTFIEVKSLRRNNKCPIYDFRRSKDRDCGKPLLYVFAIHDCKDAHTVGGIWLKMAETLKQVFVLPAWAVDLEARRHPLQTIKTSRTASGSRNGYQRKGYAEGYRNIPFTSLAASVGRGDAVKTTAGIHGVRFEAMAHFHPAVEPWL